MAEEKRKFGLDIIVRFIAKFVLRLRSLFFLPLIAKNLGSAQYGIWTQITITLALLLPALMLRLETATVRYLSSKEPKKRSQDFFSMLLLIFVTLIPVFSLGYVFRQTVYSFLFGDADAPMVYILLFLLLMLVKTFYKFVLNYYRAFSQIKKYSSIQVLTSFAGLGLAAFFVLNGSDVSKVILAFILIQSFSTTIVILDIIRLIGLPERLSFFGLKPYLKYSIPLIPNALLYWAINYSDRFVITHILGVSEVGVYSASYSLGKMATFFLTPISIVLFPKISRLWENDKLKEVKSYMEGSITYFLMFALPSVLGIYFLAPTVLETLATGTFVTNRLLVLLITLGFLNVGVYQIYLYTIHLKEQTKYLPIMFFGIALLNLGLNFFLVPRIGILGAAIATLISYGLQASIVTVWALKIFALKFNFVKIAKSLGSALMMYGILHLFDPNGLGTIVLTVLVGGIVYLLALIFTRALGKKEWVLIKDLVQSKRSSS